MNSFGRYFKITTFGESHGPMNGVVIDGLPAGLTIDQDFITRELARRRPSGQTISTSRLEPDKWQLVSGVSGGKTNGAPLTILIPNEMQNSADYQDITDYFRPGHGDYSWYKKYGQPLGAGGGRLSGRETVARVAAGAVAKLFLREKSGMEILGYSSQIGPLTGQKVDWDFVEQNVYRVADGDLVPQLDALMEQLRREGDSIGGTLHLCVKKVPAGLGGPVFDKLEAQLGAAMLSIGGVKGILFGAGAAFSYSRGSQMNDGQQTDGSFLTNNHGGILGGISSGAPIEFDLIIKAVPSIARPQMMLSREGTVAERVICGRHDCCLCPRLLPVAEAMTALVLADNLMELTCQKL